MLKGMGSEAMQMFCSWLQTARSCVYLTLPHSKGQSRVGSSLPMVPRKEANLQLFLRMSSARVTSSRKQNQECARPEAGALASMSPSGGDSCGTCVHTQRNCKECGQVIGNLIGLRTRETPPLLSCLKIEDEHQWHADSQCHFEYSPHSTSRYLIIPSGFP
jgi:hypothetical protein